MNAKEAATAFEAWAQENNLIGAEFPIVLDVPADQRDELFDSLKISAASEHLLRTKHLTLIGFNEVRKEVVAFTAKSLTAKDLKILPQTFGDDVAVKYIHGGAATAGVPTGGMGHAPYAVSANGQYTCGSSIHPARSLGAGTLGCLVRNAGGELFGLTNNHVSGLCSYASSGEKILAPGHPDITADGLDPFTIGYHFASLPMVPGVPDNIEISLNRDAAIFRIADPGKVSSKQGAAYDTPLSAAPIVPSQNIEKVGRSTGHTKGIVQAEVLGAFPVTYTVQGIGNPVCYFLPVFVAVGVGGIPFSEEGDSGSLVVAEVDGVRKGVGLVFAGNKNGHSFIIPLQPILDSFGVTLVSNHNV